MRASVLFVAGLLALTALAHAESGSNGPREGAKGTNSAGTDSGARAWAGMSYAGRNAADRGGSFGLDGGANEDRR